MSTAVFKQLRATQLQELCTNCGILKSGTKSALWQKLMDIDMPTTTKVKDATRNILSIDLGIKNIALCYMTLPDDSKTSLKLPIIRKWMLTDLMGWNDHGAFHQPQFANLAVDFVQRYILDNCPAGFPIDMVLIEEQRIRSSGAGEVPETIARLNILEAMIHTVLATKRCKEQQGQEISSIWPSAVSMSPSRVMGYWVRTSDPVVRGQLSSHKRYALTKSIKKNIVSNWIREASTDTARPMLILEEGSLEAAQMVSSQLKSKALKKTDDLCDSLLQGITWMHWNQNKNLLIPKVFNDIDTFIQVLDTSTDRWRSACKSYPADQ